MAECNHCGQCCFIGQGENKKPCRYLILTMIIEHDKPVVVSRCRIYSRRIGAYCGKIDGVKHYCHLYVDRKEKEVGCPLNEKNTIL